MTYVRLFAALLVVILATLAAACGDDDEDGASPTDGSTATATATPDDNGETPTDGPGDGDETTPPDEKTPIGGDGDGNGGNGTDAPTFAATPAPVGTPAVHIPDIGAWLNENYPGVSPQETDCVYNPATAVTTCDGVQYAVDPPLSGQDVDCFAVRVNGEAVAIRCTSQDPLTTIYYEIQG